MQSQGAKVRKPLGCWIVVFDRSALSTIGHPYNNHYIAKRLVTTKEYDYPNGIGHHAISKILGITRVKRGIASIGEGLFFLGRFYKTFQLMKEELNLDPARHAVRIMPASDCMFPERFFRRPGLKELVSKYGDASVLALPLSPALLQFWDTSSDFVYTVGITAAVVLFVYFAFKEARRIF
jgi:hypothetical protein